MPFNFTRDLTSQERASIDLAMVAWPRNATQQAIVEAVCDRSSVLQDMRDAAMTPEQRTEAVNLAWRQQGFND